MDVVLIGNYPGDRQHSMRLFAESLAEELKKLDIEVDIWRPRILFASAKIPTSRGRQKWLGYIDKFVLFPPVLLARRSVKRARGGSTVYHVCDHSNSPYLKYLPRGSTVITCHDVLAIRGALGDKDAYCPASRFGVFFQRWILRHLRRARWLTAVSHKSLADLRALGPIAAEDVAAVIPNMMNAPFGRLSSDLARDRLLGRGLDFTTPYLLHVGSGHPRKNRGVIVDAARAAQWDGNVVFAGRAIDPLLRAKLVEGELSGRAIEVVDPTHDELVALYSLAYAFIFPSLSEGFGWPIIEAQACGAPVIASQLSPMPEVGGDAALYADPKDATSIAASISQLRGSDVRLELRSNARENLERYEPSTVATRYVDLYRRIVK